MNTLPSQNGDFTTSTFNTFLITISSRNVFRIYNLSVCTEPHQSVNQGSEPYNSYNLKPHSISSCCYVVPVFFMYLTICFCQNSRCRKK